MNDQTKPNPPLVRLAMDEGSLTEVLSRTELEQAIAAAHKYPRSMDSAMKRVEQLTCYDEETAAICMYALPRAGKPIKGPSVGFANLLMQSWGNCQSGSRVIAVDRGEKVVIAQGVFMDFETNTRTLREVQRRIVDKEGRLYSTDMIIVTGNACASIARRNAILDGISRPVWFPSYQKVEGIVTGNAETFAVRKEKAMAAFAQFGVKPEKVIAALGLSGEADLEIRHMPFLRGMYTALKNEEVTVEEMFDPRRLTGQAFERVPNPLGDEGEAASDGLGEEGTSPKPKKARARKPRKPAGEPAGEGSSEPGDGQPPVPTGEQAGTGPEVTLPSNPAQGQTVAVQAGKEPVTVKQPSAEMVRPKLPKSPTEYFDYAKGVLAHLVEEGKGAVEINAWVNSKEQRDLRGSCSVIGDDLDAFKVYVKSLCDNLAAGQA